MNPLTLLARALDALHSRVEAIKDWLDGWHPVFAGDELDSHVTYADDTEEA